MFRTDRLLGSLALFISLGGAAMAQTTVRHIEIRSSWGGLGPSSSSDLIIQNEGGRYRLDGTTIEPRLIEALISALRAPAIRAPQLDNLGLTDEWLSANAASAGAKNNPFFATVAPDQRALFMDTFRNREVIGKLLPKLFDRFVFDDYPLVRVNVVFDDDSKLSAESRSPNQLMLPWDGEGGTTYDAGISRAVAALLPEKTTNRERLANDRLDEELARAVRDHIEKDWNLLDAERRAGKALAQIRESYAILSATINLYHHPEYGVTYKANGPTETNLHVSIRKASFPANVSGALALKYKNGQVEGVERFLRTSNKYESLVLSVPWLSQYIKEHPLESFRISYVHDRSFGDQAMRVLTEDMRTMGKEALARQVRSRQSDVALLIAGRAYWIVFPDQHMVLWRHDGPSGLLQWTTEDFPNGRCAAYHPSFGGCAGTEISPDGTLIKADERQTSLAACLAGKRKSGDSSPLFAVEKLGKSGFINQKGDVVIPFCFDAAGDFSEGLALFEKDGRWGFVDAAGNVQIPAQFGCARDFSEGLAPVQVTGMPCGLGSRWSFIDRTGKLVIPELDKVDGIVTDPAGFRNGLARIQQGGNSGFIDRTGRIVIPPRFAVAYDFSEGTAAACLTYKGQCGFIDTQGAWVVQPQFEWTSSFSEGLAPVNRRNSCGYVDRSGAVVLSPPVRTGENDCASVWGHFNGGLSRWKFGNKYGYIDHAGTTVIEPRFDLTFEFSEGLAAVLIGEKWGYINTAGKMVIQPIALHSAKSFHNGLAKVVTPDFRHGYIDRTGKYVWGPSPRASESQ